MAQLVETGQLTLDDVRHLEKALELLEAKKEAAPERSAEKGSVRANKEVG